MLNPIKELIEWKKHLTAAGFGAGAGFLQLLDPVIALFGTDARFWMAFAGMVPSTLAPSLPSIGQNTGLALSAGLISLTLVSKLILMRRGD